MSDNDEVTTPFRAAVTRTPFRSLHPDRILPDGSIEVISLFHVVTYVDGSPIERDPKPRYACTQVAMDDVEGGDDHDLRQTA